MPINSFQISYSDPFGSSESFFGFVCHINKINKGIVHETPWDEWLHQLIGTRLL